MKRIIFDVPRWSIYLHRESRALDSADRDDGPGRQFEDELFERLYAGAAEELPDDKKSPMLQAWAEGVHGACDQLPTFARLQAECRGDADSAAAAVECLMSALDPLVSEVEPDPHRLRRVVVNGCDKASAAVEEQRDATEGLENVRFGQSGTGTAAGERRRYANLRALARRIRNDRRLQRIAVLAGRFKRIALQKQRTKVKHGSDEITDVERGGDLGRLLPAELGKLVNPRLRLVALRDLSERQCMQYALTGTETLGKGPLVACLDKSGSMNGQPDEWATAVALALLEVAHRQRRPFALLCFDGNVKYESFVDVGGDLPEDGLFVSCDGGTSIDLVVARAVGIIAEHPGSLRKADIVIITDGGSDTANAQDLRERAHGLGITVLGFGIGVVPEMLAPWCDEVYAVSDIDRLDDKTADKLFAR